MGAGRMRFMRGPSFTYASETYRRSTSTSSDRFCAFAMADFNTFSTVGAMRLLVVRSVVIACPACCPRMRSTTSRAFCGETRMYLASALASMFKLPLASLPSPSSGRFRRLFSCGRSSGFHRMPLELPRGRKFTKLVPHHVLGDIHRDKFPAVMHGDRVTHEFR